MSFRYFPIPILFATLCLTAHTFGAEEGESKEPAKYKGCKVKKTSGIKYIDGDKTETITVSAVNGSILTCSALANGHAVGAVVSMLPADLKEAAYMATSAFLRARSSDSMVLAQSVQTPGPVARDGQRWQLLADAGRIIDQYARVR